MTAEYFMLDGLKKLALERFESKLGVDLGDEFVDCIREVYAHTTASESELRRAVVNTASSYRHELWEVAAFRDLARDGGDFVVDLMGDLLA